MEALGINIVDITIYLIIFFFVYLVINSKLVKPISQMLSKRQAEIRDTQLKTKQIETDIANQSKANQEKAAVFSQELQAKEKNILANAKIEAKAIIEKADKEASEIIAKAKQQIDLERSSLEKDINEKIAKAVDQVVKDIYKVNKVEFDQALIKNALDKLK